MTVAHDDKEGIQYRQRKEDGRTGAREKKESVWWMSYTEERMHPPSIWADGPSMHSPEQKKEDSFDKEQN